ncbi:hypothetical protein [Sulfurovum sp.]|uniref:hypothetical protein n=1 Tax=Sulfurovum sp. TaxID=1969726 RepID=UPI0035698656
MEMILKFSKCDGEMAPAICRAMGELGGKSTVSINGVEQEFQTVQIDSRPVSGSRDYHKEQYLGYQYEYAVTLQSVEKSKQELDAEDAVKKAKTSLEAAEAVLQSVKGV